jgi:hypothetical protein
MSLMGGHKYRGGQGEDRNGRALLDRKSSPIWARNGSKQAHPGRSRSVLASVTLVENKPNVQDEFEL